MYETLLSILKISSQSRDVKKPQKYGIVESLRRTVLCSQDEAETDKTITRVTSCCPCRDLCMIQRLHDVASTIVTVQVTCGMLPSG